MLVDNAVMYELKTVSTLGPEQYKRALNYLFLLGLQHGKLINFRPVSVEKRFVSTTLLPKNRHNFALDDRQWLELDADSAWLQALILALLKEWGAFLETALYCDAIYHFRGGEDQVVKNIEISLEEAKIGTQRVRLINADTAFKLTAITRGLESYEQHLRRFIRLTNLGALQWVNFNHHLVSFKTILNPRN